MARLTAPPLYDVSTDVAQKLDQFDFVLVDGSDAQGFRVDWSSTDTPPVLVTHESQEVTGGQDSTEGDELYSSRDLVDAYRIIYRDFGGGAGQISRDSAGYAPNRFYRSSGIDISDPSGLKLMPAFEMLPYTGLRGSVCEYGGTIAVTVAMGPDTNNRMQVAFYHPETPGELWTYAPGITADYEAVSLCTDGEWIYVSLGTGGVWRGKDPRIDATAWTQYSSVTSISYMCYCSGYLYGVQSGSVVGRIRSIADGSFDEFDVAGALSPARSSFGLSAVGSWVYWGVCSGARSWVYALQYNPGAAGATPSELFEQYVELPTGFVGSCLEGYLGQLFIGGNNLSRVSGKSQGAVYLATEQGIALLTNLGEDPNRDPDAENEAVQGIDGYGHELWIVTSSSIYLWNLRNGGLVRVGTFDSYATEDDITTSQQVSWVTPAQYGLEFLSTSENLERPEVTNDLWVMVPANNSSFAFMQGVKGGLEFFPDATVTMSAASVYAAPTRENKYPATLDVAETLRIYPNSSTPHREARAWYYKPWTGWQGQALDNAIGSTFEVKIARMNGHCAEFGIRDGTKEFAIRLSAGTTSTNLTWRLQVGRWKGSDGYDFWSSQELKDRIRLHTIRLTLIGDEGVVYVDGTELYRTKPGELRPCGGELPVYDEEGESFYFSGGWCWNRVLTTHEDYNDEIWLVDYASLKFALNGAWPDDVAIVRTVTSTTNFTVLNSTPYIPSTGERDGLLYLDWDHYSSALGENYLTTSWSTARMPGVLKDFSFVDIAHDPVGSGEQLQVTLETDEGTSILPPIEETDESLTKIALENIKGTRIRVILKLIGAAGVSSPRVSCITLRFGVAPIDRVQLLTDLRNGVRMLTGEVYDAAAARLWLEERIMAGSPLTLYRRSGEVRVRIEAAQDMPASPSSMHNSEPQGRIILRMKVVT